VAPFERLAGEDFCYLTTVGRRSGKAHTIEIWFALENGKLYLLSGEATPRTGSAIYARRPRSACA
jgi:hypothetical protein